MNSPKLGAKQERPMPLAQMLLQVLVTYGPDALKAWTEVLHKNDPKPADFLAILDSISQERYEDFINAAKLAHAQSPTPTPAPPAAPPANDPGEMKFATLEEAKAHLGGEYVMVIQQPDGDFVVWPNVGPLPGTRVFPV